MNEYSASHFDYYDNTLTDDVHLMLPLPCNAVWSSFQIFLSLTLPLSLSLSLSLFAATFIMVQNEECLTGASSDIMRKNP